MEETPVQPPAEEKPQLTAEEIASTNAKKKKRNKLILWAVFITVIILVPVLIYFIKQCEISKLKEQHSARMIEIQKKDSSFVAQTNNVNLGTVVRVLAWAVRSEVTRANLDQANQYIAELVKTKAYKQVIVIADDGRVILSTDKKYEGEKFITFFTDELLGNNEVKIIPQKDGNLMASAPVMGDDKRLGTVVVTYTPAVLN
jgi:hypothetical protein